jgi:hypothetical protein
MAKLFEALIDSILIAPNREGFMRHSAYWSRSHNPHVEPIERFCIVGAHSININDPRSEDMKRFCSIFAYLRESNIPISPDFTLDAPDLTTNGRDYKNETSKTDVTIFSYVDDYNEDPTSHRKFAARFEQSESKLGFSICHGMEVNLEQMRLADYMPLGRARDYDSDPTFCNDIMRTQGLRWQVIGHKGFIEHAGPHASIQTVMGLSMHQQKNILRKVRAPSISPARDEASLAATPAPIALQR